MKALKLRHILFLLIAFFSITKSAYSQSMVILRDSEVETFVKEISAPIFKAADIDPDSINIYIVQDQSLNAFVANGLNLFINSGTITESENYNELIGVIAHETGHIMGGHLARSQEKLEDLQQTSLITAIIAGAAAVASGKGEVGAAIATGTQTSALGSYMNYRKNEERSADKSATDLLAKTGNSAAGLLSFMKRIKQQEFFISDNGNQDEYFRTHPLTRERITYIENHVKAEKNIKPNKELENRFKNVKAKLYAYIEPSYKTFIRYKDNYKDHIYAKTIAYMKEAELQEAINHINALIKNDENNPFYHELKAQIYFENGNISKAIKQYKIAHDLLPKSELINLAYAQSLTADLTGIKGNKEAVKLLNEILIEDSKNINAWRLLSIAYNNIGRENAAKYAATELSFAKRNYPLAKKQAKELIKKLDKNSSFYYKVQDILTRTDTILSEGKKIRR